MQTMENSNELEWFLKKKKRKKKNVAVTLTREVFITHDMLIYIRNSSINKHILNNRKDTSISIFIFSSLSK